MVVVIGPFFYEWNVWPIKQDLDDRRSARKADVSNAHTTLVNCLPLKRYAQNRSHHERMCVLVRAFRRSIVEVPIDVIARVHWCLGKHEKATRIFGRP